MTVKDLIEELKKYDETLPVCIDEYMGFVEAHEKTIDVRQKRYMSYPFTEYDKLDYIDLISTAVK